jgi:hypothetical protein
MRFSFQWFFGVFLVHFLASVFAGFLTLITILGASPTHNPSGSVAFSQMFFWVWQTGPAFLVHYTGVTWEKGLLPAVIVWSSIVGLAAGFVAPKLFKNTQNA